MTELCREVTKPSRFPMQCGMPALYKVSHASLVGTKIRHVCQKHMPTYKHSGWRIEPLFTLLNEEVSMTRKIVFLEQTNLKVANHTAETAQAISEDLDQCAENPQRLLISTVYSAAAYMRGYSLILSQLPPPKEKDRSLSASDEFNTQEAPLQSVEARYQDLLAQLGCLSHDGAVEEIRRLREHARLDEPKTAIASQEKVRDVTMKTERVGVYVARLDGEDNRPSFAHPPHPHRTVEEAQAEAKRLARKEPEKKFGVFTCMGFFQMPPRQPEWTYTHCKKDD